MVPVERVDGLRVRALLLPMTSE
jgi:hypothetical protein